MARLSQDSDSDDFPDLADLVLRPKVPLASTSANDRASKIPNPRSTSITTIARRLEVQDGHLPGSHNSLERKSRSPRKTQEREATIIDHTGSAERPTARRQRTLLAELKEALSSSEEDSDAFISFTPPRLKSPLRRPPKETPDTPPQSPSKAKLTSPKKPTLIPPTLHRPSLDAFWSQESVNAWNDEYSPKKMLQSPRKAIIIRSDDERESVGPKARAINPQKSPVKKTRAEIQDRKAFDARKQSLAELFLDELDEKVGAGQVQRMAASTGGIKLEWSKKLNTTAGRAHWRREGTKVQSEDGTFVTMYKHTASIELAEKIIDDEDRLLNVVAHEYCHLANFMISQVTNEPHGASFKAWAAKTSSAFGARGIHVTTKHDYTIAYKYVWQCSKEDCATQYKRHSKSIDTKKQSCGKCKSRLLQILPVPKGAAMAEGNTGNAGAEVRTEYQQFVKEQFSVVRAELPQMSPMKDVMKELGVRYRLKKELGALKSDIDGKTKTQGDHVDDVARVLDFLNIKDNE